MVHGLHIFNKIKDQPQTAHCFTLNMIDYDRLQAEACDST